MYEDSLTYNAGEGIYNCMYDICNECLGIGKTVGGHWHKSNVTSFMLFVFLFGLLIELPG
jgi:hypothetical protein